MDEVVGADYRSPGLEQENDAAPRALSRLERIALRERWRNGDDLVAGQSAVQVLLRALRRADCADPGCLADSGDAPGHLYAAHPTVHRQAVDPG